MIERMTVARALAALEAADDEHYGVLLERGSLEIGYYVPGDADEQEPHDRDEVYVVVTGKGTFIHGDDAHDFEPGEALFVPAGVSHRFENYSDDFAAWVIFYGPAGGEGAS
jgi:mannose-6-phosphate isomerase-like protein (cupin superfamily)